MADFNRGEQGAAAGDAVPRWLWRAGIAGLAAVLLGLATLLGLALHGLSAPPTAGPLVVDVELDARLQVDVLDTRRVQTLPHDVSAPLTVELTARQLGGDGEATYGVWLGNNAENALAVALNGNGYFSIYAVQGGARHTLAELQRFPHVHPQGETNRIRVHIVGEQLEVRINDEVMASLPVNETTLSGDRPSVGVFVETLDTGGTSAAFERLRVWAAD